MRRHVHILVGLALVALCAGAESAAGRTNKAHEYLKRPNWGRLVGFVVDAETQEPVEGAAVTVEVDGEFAAEGQTVGQTDEQGRYEVRAPMGRIKEATKFDLLVLLGAAPIEKREERLLYITQANLRVEREGYKPLLAPVRAAHASLPNFILFLHDILLAKRASDLPSFSPDNTAWEALQEFSVVPTICEPGEKVTIKAVMRLPREKGAYYQVHAVAQHKIFARGASKLKRPKGPQASRLIEYVHELPVASRPEREAQVVRPVIYRRLGVVEEAWVPAGAPKVLVQAVNSPERRRAAELCQEAFQLQEQGQLHEALAKAEAATQAAGDYRYAFELCGDLQLALNHPDAAAASYRRMLELKEDVEEGRPKLAEALIAAGQPEEALETLEPLDKDPARLQAAAESKMSSRFNVALARCHLALGHLDQADERLRRAIDIPPDLRKWVALERAQALLRGQPDSVDGRLALAHALLDLERPGEALAEFSRAAEMDRGDAWKRVEMAQALSEPLGRHEEAAAQAQVAVSLDPTNGDALLALGDAYRHLGRYEEAASVYDRLAGLRPSDFQARHWQGLMHLWRGQAEQADAELQAALRLAEEKGAAKSGYVFNPIFVHTKTKRMAWGFRHEEADWDYVILDSLRALEQHPEAFLPRYNVARALVEVGLPGAAIPRLEGLLAERPDYVEAKYYLAKAHLEQGDRDTARRELLEVLAANTRHPYARLDLARMALAEGDVAGAHRYVAAHLRDYPESGQSREMVPTTEETE
ncbi:MAG: tetratricopeptide repeat protein [Armatimonadota bacterium]